MYNYSLNDCKKSRLVVLSLWLVYASAYFARTSYSASIASIVSEGVYDKSRIGLVGTAFFICYGAGQIISGVAGDRANPFAMVLTGAFGSSLCCFGMSFSGSLSAMIILWGANGIFQSMLWAPLLRIFSETINESLREKAVLNIALSLPVGTVLAYISSTLIIRYSRWKYIFICGGAVMLLSFIFAALSFASVRGSVEKTRRTERVKNEIGNEKEKGFGKAVLSSGLIIIAVPSFLHGMMRDGITNWVPTMITEEYGVMPSFSVFVTVALPVFNALGAYAVTPLYKKLGNDEMKASGVCALFSLVPMSLLLLIGKIPVFIAVLLLALTTMSMYSLNYLIISKVPVRFSSYGHTSSVTGILNAAAYIGCALSSYGFGAVSESKGWSVVIIIWMVSAAGIFVFSLLADKKWKKFKV